MSERLSPAADRASTARTTPPSNAPTIFLLLLVLAAFVFVGWWAFWGKGARAGANAVLPSSLPTPHAARPAPAVAPPSAALPLPSANGQNP